MCAIPGKVSRIFSPILFDKNFHLLAFIWQKQEYYTQKTILTWNKYYKPPEFSNIKNKKLFMQTCWTSGNANNNNLYSK